MAEAAPELLAVEGLEAWYGESHVLHGMSFGIRVGEVVTLLGRNGVGKTTTMRALMGMMARRTGKVRFDGRDIVAMPSNKIARLGMAYCPEERGIFALPDGSGKSCAAAGGPAGRAVLGRNSRAVSTPCRTRRQSGHQIVRRRAADAGDRPDPADRGQDSVVGRAHRRFGSGHRRPYRRDHPEPEGPGLHHLAGRTEFPTSRRPSPIAITSSNMAR